MWCHTVYLFFKFLMLLKSQILWLHKTYVNLINDSHFLIQARWSLNNNFFFIVLDRFVFIGFIGLKRHLLLTLGCRQLSNIKQLLTLGSRIDAPLIWKIFIKYRLLRRRNLVHYNFRSITLLVTESLIVQIPWHDVCLCRHNRLIFLRHIIAFYSILIFNRWLSLVGNHVCFRILVILNNFGLNNVLTDVLHFQNKI